MVANMSSEPDLISFIAVSSDDMVIASNLFSEVGLNWQSLTIKPELEHIHAVLARRSMDTVLTSNKKYLDGYSSLCTASEKVLRSKDCGFIFYRINMD